MARPPAPGGISFPKLYFDVEPDEEEIRTDLMLLSKKMGDYKLPLLRSKTIIIGDVKEAFETETDPRDGKRWDALSLRASKVPRYGKLQRKKTNRRMYRAMISRNNYGVSKEGVFLNQSRIPEYFVYHQQDEGGSAAPVVTVPKAVRAKMVQREFIALVNRGAYKGKSDRVARLKEDAYATADAKISAGVEGSMAGTGLVPQRRFIGPSPGATNEIKDTFDLWAKDVIIIYKRGKNYIASTRRGLK